MTRVVAVAIAAFLAACQPADHQAKPSRSDAAVDGLCDRPVTPVAEVQGIGFESPMANAEVTVRGVVTWSDPSQGLYLQDTSPFLGQGASHGILIAAPELADQFRKGTLMTASGTVAELGERVDTMTALTAVSQAENCGPGPDLQEIDARLPLNPTERETFEAMHILLEQTLTITEARDVSRGEISVSALGLLRAPTEIGLPGDAARAVEQKNRDWSLAVENPSLTRLEPFTEVHAGAVLNVLSGVLGHDGHGLRLKTGGDLGVVKRPFPRVPAAPEGAIRVASFNLYEFFNGDGRGGGFPGERGARSQREYRRQSDRIVAAIAEIRPDVLAVMELENDGFGDQSAVQDLKRSLSRGLDVEFEVATPESERAGPDAIAVGMLFRSDRLEAVGPAQLLEGGSMGPLNRVPLAQAFIDRVSGERFLVVSNHLKSKSFCPQSGPDTDQGDGQACWNPTRVNGAEETVRWAQALAAATGTEHLLLAGDFNAYRREDPVRAIKAQGFVELAEKHNPNSPLYSYIYRGAAGTLDYVFASPSLARFSNQALIWNINAAYPWSGRPSEPWLRSSDHDPVVVDLLFSQPATAD